MIDLREEEILAKLDRDEKICATCKSFMEFRLANKINLYGNHSGYCTRLGIPSNDVYIDDYSGWGVIVLADSTCDRYQSIYRE